MKNTIKKVGKGLSIKELEERMELSISSTGAEMEIAKGNRCDGTVDVEEGLYSDPE